MGYILNPHQFAGVVACPSGMRLQLLPKVRVANLLPMLAHAYELIADPFLDLPVEAGTIDDVLEFSVAYFAGLVEERIRKGLHRAYQEEEENLPAIRGRIVFEEDSRRNRILRHQTFCRYSNLTWDIPENQVIRQVIHMLSRWDFRRPLNFRLRQLDATLSELTLSHFRASVVARFHYHRLTASYRPIHTLCRLFLEHVSMSEGLGPHPFRSFVIDMNKLFEAFVSQAIFKACHWPASANLQRYTPFDVHSRVSMRPDILISSYGEPQVVADCKYKRIGIDEFKWFDHYQVLAYCTALGVDRAMLIYPKHEQVVEDELEILNSPVTIRQLTIDLDQPWSKLLQECRS